MKQADSLKGKIKEGIAVKRCGIAFVSLEKHSALAYGKKDLCIFCGKQIKQI
jgi:hypothetical protein